MRVHHLALGVHNLEAQADFYGRVLGLQVVQWNHDDAGAKRSVWLALGEDDFLALERVGRPPRLEDAWYDDSPGYFLLALRIGADEREHWEARLREHGIAVHHRTQWTLYLRDPEGNRVALSHHPEDA
jgi:catechol 2,3-dioxygenase-like lactoylglutathione lyase family enzyme